MAGVITLSSKLTVTNGGFYSQFAPTLLTLVQTGQGAHETTVTVGTSEEDMPIGDVVTEGWLALRNIDPTNYVQWGPKSGGVMVPLGILRPATDGLGTWAILELDTTTTIRWIANTAPCKVLMKLFEA